MLWLTSSLSISLHVRKAVYSCAGTGELMEQGDMGLFSMELIIERTRAHDMAGRVIVRRALCLSMPDPSLVDPLITANADAGIEIMTTALASRPVPAVKQLMRSGVVVFAGSVGTRATWGSYGNADMLERAMSIGIRNSLRRDDESSLALDIVTTEGAKALDLQNYGLMRGCGSGLG